MGRLCNYPKSNTGGYFDDMGRPLSQVSVGKSHIVVLPIPAVFVDFHYLHKH